MLRIRLTNANQIYRNLINGRYPIRGKMDLKHGKYVSDGATIYFLKTDLYAIPTYDQNR